MTTLAPPDRTEAAEYYFTYINQVPAGDILKLLDAQVTEALAQLRQISEARSLYRYAPDKWTFRQVLNHINDTERVFAFRAFWFGRGLEGPLPSFEQDIAIASADADGRSWKSHMEELAVVRSASRMLFDTLPEEAWGRRGLASGHPVTVRALAYIIVGHAAHHLRVLRERYG